jgi:peptide/nickel transport system permease protein
MTAVPGDQLAGSAAPAAALPRGRGMPPLLTFLGRRLAALVLVVWAVEVATFLMVRLIPGDPAREVLGPRASAAAIAGLRRQLGLDQPILTQYIRYTAHVLQLNFGTSFYTRLPVSQQLASRAGPEIELIGTAVLLVLALGVVGGLCLGIATQDSRHPRLESLAVLVAGIIGSVPGYVAATGLAFAFAVTLKIFPVAGNSPADAVVLPALSVALPPAALLARIVRVETLNALAQNYVRSARSKRLSRPAVYLRYVLPNVLTAALTLGGTIFTQCIGSAIIVESVFAWNGLGLLLTQAVLHLDFPVVEGAALLLALIVVAVNTLVDVAVSLVDPRSAAGRGLAVG